MEPELADEKQSPEAVELTKERFKRSDRFFTFFFSSEEATIASHARWQQTQARSSRKRVQTHVPVLGRNA